MRTKLLYTSNFSGPSFLWLEGMRNVHVFHKKNEFEHAACGVPP